MYKKPGIYLLAVLLVFSLALIATGCPAPVAEPQPDPEEEPATGRQFEDVTITVFTQPPPFIAKPVMMFGPDWEEATGGKVNLVTAPWAELYPRMFSSFSLEAANYDIIIFPAAWLADFAGAGFLSPLDDLIAADPYIDWNDILPAYRERISVWNDVTYAVPLDGDSHLFYYRKDALENTDFQGRFKEQFGYELPAPPRTWAEHRDIAEFFHGWDWSGDGAPDVGVVEAMRRLGQADWTFFSRAASYVSIPGQHGLFFDPETMEPLINSPGHVRALEDWLKIIPYGDPGMIMMDSGEVRMTYAMTDISMAIDWGDIGVLADTHEDSVARGLVGYSIMPGTTEVWDHKADKWVNFPDVNHAPYLAFGGWLAAIDANSPNVEAAYDFISFLSRPENSYISVVTPMTGYNPYRISHFEKLAGWYGMGFVNPGAYLEAIKATIEHPNVQVDLRIPGAARYFDAIDAQISLALAGDISPQEALDAAAKEWDLITEELGREAQLQAFRASLGLPAQ
ncbi:MAG: extracellular solute-binding protein [Dethiobacter sp.]|nr:extracellular solute-binding protein [Dethiobacter sp.]